MPDSAMRSALFTAPSPVRSAPPQAGLSVQPLFSHWAARTAMSDKPNSPVKVFFTEMVIRPSLQFPWESVARRVNV